MSEGEQAESMQNKSMERVCEAQRSERGMMVMVAF